MNEEREAYSLQFFTFKENKEKPGCGISQPGFLGYSWLFSPESF
jgi:hypothetical protein